MADVAATKMHSSKVECRITAKPSSGPNLAPIRAEELHLSWLDKGSPGASQGRKATDLGL